MTSYHMMKPLLGTHHGGVPSWHVRDPCNIVSACMIPVSISMTHVGMALFISINTSNIATNMVPMSSMSKRPPNQDQLMK